MKIQSVYNVVHFFNISVLDPKDRNTVAFLSWNGLSWELRQKYDWYFKYRAALLQVNYPKFLVTSKWGNEPAKGRDLKNLLERKIRAKRGKISSFKNKLSMAELTWNSIFPIQDDVLYQKCVSKIGRLEAELIEMIKDFNAYK